MTGPGDPPPADNRVASGSTSAVEWYRRGFCAAAPTVHWFVFGSQIMAVKAVSTSSFDTAEPPVTTTLPSASTVPVLQMRLGPGPATEITTGVLPLMSSTIALPSSATRKILPPSNIANDIIQ